MSPTRWSPWLASGPSRPRRRRRGACPPRLELLEDRTLL